MEIRLEFRGLYQTTYQQILLQLGGKKIAATESGHPGGVKVEGSGWTAELEPEENLAFSKVMMIPRTFITFQGDPEVVDRIVTAFRRKALRGGG